MTDDVQQEYGILLETDGQPIYVIEVSEGDPKKIITAALREYNHLTAEEKESSRISVAVKTAEGWGHRIWRKGKGNA